MTGKQSYHLQRVHLEISQLGDIQWWEIDTPFIWHSKTYYCTIEWEVGNGNAGLAGMCPANQFRQEKRTSQPISCHTLPDSPLPALGSGSIDKCWGISAVECEDS